MSKLNSVVEAAWRICCWTSLGSVTTTPYPTITLTHTHRQNSFPNKISRQRLEELVIPSYAQASMQAYKKHEKSKKQRDLQDGGRVRQGDHLPLHKYIRNTSTYGTTPTEHLLNTGRRPQTSQKARNSPCTWVGQKKKEKTETNE